MIKMIWLCYWLYNQLFPNFMIVSRLYLFTLIFTGTELTSSRVLCAWRRILWGILALIKIPSWSRATWWNYIVKTLIIHDANMCGISLKSSLFGLNVKLVICMFLLFPILQAIRIRRLNSQTRIQVIHQNESPSTVPAPPARPHGAGGVYDC